MNRVEPAMQRAGVGVGRKAFKAQAKRPVVKAEIVGPIRETKRSPGWQDVGDESTYTSSGIPDPSFKKQNRTETRRGIPWLLNTGYGGRGSDGREHHLLQRLDEFEVIGCD